MKKWIYIIVPVLLLVLVAFLFIQNNEKLESKMADAFISQFCSDSKISQEDVTIVSYGTYDGCIVVDINIHLDKQIWPDSEKVGAYNFHYSRDSALMAYRDGVYKSLQKAYAEGWLDNEDVEKVHRMHKQVYWDLYWSCLGGVENSADPMSTTSGPPPTTTVPVPTTTEPVPTTTAPPPTTEPINAELEYFNELFRWDQERNPYAYVFGIEFASPKELKLWSFFDGGFPGEHEITDAEWEELSKLLADPVNVAGDFNRLPKDKMEAELQAVFGISLEDMSDSAFSGLFYLESSDCYCFYQSGVHSYRKIGSFLDVKHNDDGTISLSYISDASKTDTFVITLKPNGDSYQILSNVKLG